MGGRGTGTVPPEARPLLLAVDRDPSMLARIESELERAFGSDFRVRGELAAADAVGVLEVAHREEQRVAVVLVDHALPAEERTAVFSAARRLHPDARRALLIEWGAWAVRETATAILQAMSLGDISYYVLKPWINRDEFFHRVVAEFVQEWSRTEPSNYREVVVVSDQRAPRAHAVGNLLERNGIPHAFRPRGSRLADAVLAELPARAQDAEVVVWMPALGGRLLLDPTDAEVVEAWGIPTSIPDTEGDFDVLVVGAGPAGLAAAVYASSEGLNILAIEREALGGQAGTSSLIRNYLGFSRGVSGAELAQRGYQQAWVFGAHFVLTREVTLLKPDADGFVAEVSDVGQVRARAVVLATGVSYRRLGIESLDQFTGAGVYYGANVSAAHGLSGLRAVVVGGGNSAGQAVLHLARYCRWVGLLVRGKSLAAGMSSYLVDTITATPNVEVHTDVDVVDGGGEGRLEWVGVRDRSTGREERLDADGMFVMIGAEPRTDWLPAQVSRDGFGFVLTGSDVDEEHWPIERRPYPNETCVPGIFAVGDVRSGSVKRVASAVGEGSVVVSQLHQFLAAGHG
jgi:thioredoxin reductase (NADPH)